MLLLEGLVAPIVGVFTLGGKGAERRVVRVKGVQEPQYEIMFFIFIFLLEIIFLLSYVWYGLELEEMHLDNM